MRHPAHFGRSEDPSLCRRAGNRAATRGTKPFPRQKEAPAATTVLYGPTPKVELCLVLRVDANDAPLQRSRACVLSGRPTVPVLIVGEPLARFQDSVAGWGCVPAVPDLNRKARAAPRSGGEDTLLGAALV
jgi:hypothetical protein